MSDTTNWACPRCGAVVSSHDDHQCQIDRPMSDIVDRLRGELDNPLLKEAADEIMRLVLVAEKYHREVKRLRARDIAQ